MQRTNIEVLTSSTKNNTISVKNLKHSFNLLIENIPIGFFRINFQGQIIESNSYLSKVLTTPIEQIQSISFYSLFKNESEAILFRQKIQNDKKIHTFDAQFVDIDNNTNYVIINAVLVTTNDEEFIEGTIQDNKEKVKTLRALRISEEKYQSFSNQVPVGIYRITLNGEILFANQYLINLLDVTSFENLKGELITDFYSNHQEYIDFLADLNHKKQITFSKERYLFNKKNKKIWVFDTVTAFYDTNNDLLFLDGTMLDITSRKKAEEELKKAENKFHQFANLMPETVFEIDLDGNILYINDESYHTFGYHKRDQLPNAFKMFVKSDKKHFKEDLNRILLKGTSQGKEYLAIRKDGSTFPVMMYALPVLENNITRGFRGIITNITDLKNTEIALRESEEKYRTLIELSNDAIVIHRNGKVLFANNKANKFLGFNFLKDFTKFYEPNATKQQQEKVIDYNIEKLKGNNVPELYETILLDKKGNPVYVETNNTILAFEQSNAIMSILRDITPRVDAERKLYMLGTAINQISEAVVITDTKGFIEYVNPAFEKMSQFDQKEIIGKEISIIKSNKHSIEFYKNLWNTILNGSTWTGNIINKRKNGSFYEEYMEITPIKSPNGEIVNYIAIKKDITNELRLEKQLRESQKLQAIGTLAGGIAHDFNNILMGMQLFTDITLKKLNPESIEHKSLSKVKEAEIRAKDLISQILTFSRQTGDEREEILIHIVVKEALKMIKSTFPSSISWETNIQDCGYILGNPTHIHQIMMNLCTNSNHAMEGHGILSVVLEKVNVGPAHITSEKSKNVKNWVRFIVKDSGCGIAPNIHDRIFEPFFTTKAVGQGTGLGLATVHGIVKQYEGEIFFTSKINVGTLFYIYLPTIN